MKKIITLILSLFIITNTSAYAENEKEEHKLPDFIVVDNAEKTVENVAKKLKAETKIPNAMPQKHYDDSPILTWFFKDEKIGIVGDSDNNFLAIVYNDTDFDTIAKLLQDEHNITLDNELKDLLDTDKMPNKPVTFYFKQLDSYFVIVKRDNLNEPEPELSLMVTVDEKLFEHTKKGSANNE